jgi:hypothetical protein
MDNAVGASGSATMSKFNVGVALGFRNPANLKKYDNPTQVLEEHRAQQSLVALLGLILFSPVWVPVWAVFHIAQNTWSYIGRFMKAMAVLFMVVWIVSIVLILGAPLLRNANPAFFDDLKFYEGAVPAAIAALVLSYIVGRLLARFRPPEIHDAPETQTWM